MDLLRRSALINNMTIKVTIKTIISLTMALNFLINIILMVNYFYYLNKFGWQLYFFDSGKISILV